MEVERCSQLESKIRNAEMKDKLANLGTASLISWAVAIGGLIIGIYGKVHDDTTAFYSGIVALTGGGLGANYFTSKFIEKIGEVRKFYKKNAIQNL